MTTEKMFYRRFNIKPIKIVYHVEIYCMNTNPISGGECFTLDREMTKEQVIHYYKNWKRDFLFPMPKGEIKRVEIIYPPITPEIVLGLLEIISKCEAIDSTELVYHPLDEKYSLLATFITEFSNEKPVKELTFDETLNGLVIKMCIQLKDEIQTEVQKLFKEDF